MIGVVILNYNTWDESLECMKSILASDSSDAIRIYLVDNHSPDKRPEIVAKYCLENSIAYIQNQKNVGYAAGNNVGIRQALKDGCSTILISNSDVRYGRNSIGILHQYLSEHLDVGIVGPKIRLEDGRVQKGCIMMRTGIREKYLLRTRLRVFFPKYDDCYWGRQHDYEKETFQTYAVAGCCFMISRACAEQITPFDEGTFLYDEELIIGMRMERAGYKTMYYPESIVRHKIGKSTGGIWTNPMAYTWQICSEIYYCRSYLNMKRWQILPLYLYRVFVYVVYSFRSESFRSTVKVFFSKTWRKLRE